MCEQEQLALYSLLREVPRSVTTFTFILAGNTESEVILDNAKVWLEEDGGETGLKRIFVNDMVLDTATGEVRKRRLRESRLGMLQHYGVRWAVRAQ